MMDKQVISHTSKTLMHMEMFKGKGLVDYCDTSECSDDAGHREFTNAEEDSSDNCGGNNDERGTYMGGMEGGQANEGIGSNVHGNYGKLTHEDIMAMEFGTLEDAECFYMAYARQVGFGIQRYSLKKNVAGLPRLRTWVCHKQGRRREEWLNLPGRKHKPKLDFREDCPATFQVNFNRKNKAWVVNRLVLLHSHALVMPEHVHLLSSHRKIDEASKSEINALRQAGVDTRRVIDLLAMQSGGFDRMGFIPRDVYNHIQVEKGLESGNGDIQGVLSYFYAKKDNDPGFHFNNTVDCNQ